MYTLPRRPFAVLALLLLTLAATGCSNVPHNSVASVGGDEEGERLDAAPAPERIAALAGEIRKLSPTVDPKEAAHCADLAIRYARMLADEYDIHQPVEVNNVMINMGLKKRGLCFQLADDMNAELQAQHYKTLEFRRAVAHEDDLWEEHNCLVVSAKGQKLEDGIALDAWRNAGNLRWAPVKKDHYPWVLKVYRDDEAAAAAAARAKSAAAATATAPDPRLASAKAPPIKPVAPATKPSVTRTTPAGSADGG